MRVFAECALLPGGVAHDVVFEIDHGRFATITADSPAVSARRLGGVVVPGFADAHSHAFHRALRGRTHTTGDFWSWRRDMYAFAELLDPDSYYRLARAVYAEAVLAGITTVAEFHYLHHRPDGRPYDAPNAMGEAVIAAAGDAGMRLTLLDTCYLTAGIDGAELTGVQRRFDDGDAGAWADRVTGLRDSDSVRIGAAIHSVRAVPRDAMRVVVAAAAGRPLHAHVSEQPAENDACLAAYSMTPTGLLAAEGALGPNSTAVHATHLCEDDIEVLRRSGATVCICPTTEHDLADGVAPAAALHAGGVPMSLGSDQHVSTDLLVEAQTLEGDQRAATLRRGVFTPAELQGMLTAHRSLGWPDTGRLEVGTRADLVVIRTDTPRTGGVDPGQILTVAGRDDVDAVYVDGVAVVEDGRHRIGDVGPALHDAITELWAQR